MKPSDIANANGKPLADARLPDLDWNLLVQAFDGRPMRAIKEPDQEVMLLVCHEDRDLHCSISLKPADMDLLKDNFSKFKRSVADPMIENLDGAAYPERFERYIAAAKRTAAALVNGNTERPAAS